MILHHGFYVLRSEGSPSKSRNPRRGLSASLRSRNARGHLTKELLREPAQTKPADQSTHPNNPAFNLTVKTP